MNLQPQKRELSALLSEVLNHVQAFHIEVCDHLAELEDQQSGLFCHQLAQAHNLEAITNQIKLTISHLSDYLLDELGEVPND